MAKAAALKYLGALKFQPQEYDLASIPDNDRAAADAASMMFYIRMSALLLREGDEELEAKVRHDDNPDHWITLLEGITAALAAKRQDAKMLEAGATRLQVVLERVHRGATDAAHHSGSSKRKRR